MSYFPILRFDHRFTPLTGTTSIAIWNKKKIVLVLSSGVWVANVLFTIQSELICPLSRGDPVIHSNAMVLGIARVNNLSDYYDGASRLIPYRPVQRGHLWRTSARRLTCMS